MYDTSLRGKLIEVLFNLLFLYSIFATFIVNQPYLLPSLTNILIVTIHGIPYISHHQLDYNKVDTFEFYYLIFSMFVLNAILFYSLFDSTILKNNSVSTIVVYVASFGNLKTILKFVYQARYIKKH